MKRIGLVLQGGGTRGAFTSGVLDVIMEHKIEFPYVIGTSAGALNATGYLSGDIGRAKYISINMLSDPKFLSLTNLVKLGSYFNFSYLFHVVPEKVISFNQKAFDENPATFYMAATSCETGEATYFKKGECPLWDALAASSSLPLISKPVIVDGHPYLDGGQTAGIPWRKALEDNDKLVVVLTRPYGYRKKPLGKASRVLGKRMYREFPKYLEAYYNTDKTYNADVEELEELEKQGKAFLIYPESDLNVGHTEKDREVLEAVYNKGVAVMKKRMDAMLEFIGSKDE